MPPDVIAGLGPDIASANVVAEEPIGLGTGAATGGVARLTVRLASSRGTRQLTILRKRLVPFMAGRHAEGAMDPRHWAYWRREAEAYMAGLLPEGPGLRAPRSLSRARSSCLRLTALLPRVLSHGDYSLGNLIDAGRDVVALDWATAGWEPVGFDLAHLALNSGADPTDAYLDAMPPSPADRVLVTSGFTIAVALIGSSRLHWMMARHLEPPAWYTEFVWRHRPDRVA